MRAGRDVAPNASIWSSSSCSERLRNRICRWLTPMAPNSLSFSASSSGLPEQRLLADVPSRVAHVEELGDRAEVDRLVAQRLLAVLEQELRSGPASRRAACPGAASRRRARRRAAAPASTSRRPRSAAGSGGAAAHPGVVEVALVGRVDVGVLVGERGANDVDGGVGDLAARPRSRGRAARTRPGGGRRRRRGSPARPTARRGS